MRWITVMPLLLMPLMKTQAERVLNIPLHAAKVSLDPTGVQDRSTLWVSRQINCQLVRNQGGTLKPDLATTIKYLTPLKIAIGLNRRLQFQDGSPVTAKDVVASFNYLKHSRHVLINIFLWVKSIQAVGDSEVVFTLKKPIPQFLKVLSSPNYAIFKSSFIEKAKKDSTLWKYPVSCGGYYVKQNEGNSILLEPKNKKSFPVRFHLFAVNQLARSDVNRYDMVDMAINGNPRSLAGFTKVSIFDPRQLFIGINASKPPWRSRQNRCALLARLSTQKVVAGYQGNAKQANDLVPSGVLGYDRHYRFKHKINLEGRPYSVPAMPSPCLSFLTISIPQQYRRFYTQDIKRVYPGLRTTTIENNKSFGQTFVNNRCDFLAFDLKSNYLDTYEFIILFSEKDANYTGVSDPQLTREIEHSQNIPNVMNRISEYRRIINTINHRCLILPVATVPNEHVFLKQGLTYPNIGKGALDGYYLGQVHS